MHIKIGELLDRRKTRQGGIVASDPGPSSGPNTHSYGIPLTLLDAHGQEAGTLVIKLDPTTPRIDEAPAIDSGSDNVQPDTPEPVLNAIKGSGVVEESGEDIVNLLQQVVNETKSAADSVEETAPVCIASLS